MAMRILRASVRLRLLDAVQSGLHLSRVGGEDVEQTLLEGAGLLLSGLQAGSWITFVYALPKMTRRKLMRMGRVLSSAESAGEARRGVASGRR